MSDQPEWFAPKSYGYGTGLPISWQGWLLSIGFVLVMFASGLIVAPRSEAAFIAAMIPITGMFIWICNKTTRGGWRWR